MPVSRRTPLKIQQSHKSEPTQLRPGDSATVTLQSDREILISRTFAAQRGVVFDAWTKPEHVSEWWDPSGVPLAACEIDLRPGGAFRFVHRNPEGGGGRAFIGTYREIVRPARLVFATLAPTGGETLGTLIFEERDGKTHLNMTMSCVSKAARDALLKMGIDAGTVRTLDKLAAYLCRSA